MPLTDIKIETLLTNGLSHTVLTHQYKNTSSKFLETEFFFAISPSICITSFVALLDGKRIKGEIKEKEEAKKEYQYNLAEGKTVAYSEINKDSPDIMKMEIGNI